MTEHHHRLRICGLIILCRDGSSLISIYAKQREETPRNELPHHNLTLARFVPDSRFRVAVKRQHPPKRPIVVTVVKIVRVGERQITLCAGRTWIVYPDLHQ